VRRQVKGDFEQTLQLLFKLKDAESPKAQGPAAVHGSPARKLRYSFALPLRSVDRWADLRSWRLRFAVRDDRAGLEPAPELELPAGLAARDCVLQLASGESAAAITSQLRLAFAPNAFHAKYALIEARTRACAPACPRACLPACR
jgi:hypothetical protein